MRLGGWSNFSYGVGTFLDTRIMLYWTDFTALLAAASTSAVLCLLSQLPW